MIYKNILEYGWEIVSKTDGGLVATEIYTLKYKLLSHKLTNHG